MSSKLNKALSLDTVIWLILIHEEHDWFEGISSFLKSKKNISHHVIFDTVLNELRVTVSRNWGILSKIIEEKILEIRGREKAIGFKKFTELEDFLETNIFQILSEKQKDQYRFVKEKIWKINREKDEYRKLLDDEFRVMLYSKTKVYLLKATEFQSLELYLEEEVEVFESLDTVSDTIKEKEFKYFNEVKSLTQGSHNRGGDNKYDKLHLLSCFYYSETVLDIRLFFCTTDKRMLRKNVTDIFEILSPIELVKLLD